MIRPLLSLTLILPGTADAFCGTYVGSAGSELYNSSSQIVVAREGTRTHLTLANDFEGNASDFAMVVPVPALLGPDDVKIVDPAILARIDAYSAPRLVSYTCDELYPTSYGNGQWHGGNGGNGATEYGESGGCGCAAAAPMVGHDTAVGIDPDTDTDTDADSDTDADADSDSPLTPDAIDTVEVEAEFAVGEYEIVILSAEESEGLILWLNLSGYAIPYETEATLSEYIQAGSYFIAAKVTLDDVLTDAQYLSPLRVSYDSDVVSLPIRLGALNSRGAQNLTIFAINDAADGKVGIANHIEVGIENECMYDPDRYESFGDFYKERLRAAMDIGGPLGAWTTEYSWQPTKCDPCTDDGPLTDSDAGNLGFSSGASSAHFTRLRVHYTPAQAHQDLVLYSSGRASQEQARYIAYRDELGESFPVCGLGFQPSGTCWDDPPPPAASATPAKRIPGRAGLLLFGFALLAGIRRR